MRYCPCGFLVSHHPPCTTTTTTNPSEAVTLFKDAEEAGGRNFLKVILINTLAQTYARHMHKL